MPLHEYQKQMYKKIAVIAALIILPIAGFFTGMTYQKQTSPNSTANTDKFANGPRMMRGGGTMGTVKSVSDSSITVTDRRNSEDKTYTLTSSTTYKNGDSDAKLSDIKAGDTVALMLDTSDSSKVKTLIINPMLNIGPSEQSSSDGNATGGSMMIQ